MSYEIWITDNLWWIILSIIGVVGFSQFRKWNIEKFKAKSNNEKQKRKEQMQMPDADLKKYIAEPELTIQALKKKREIFEKANDKAGIDSIDNEIKMLQILAQIPAPVRPMAANIGQSLMKKVSGMVDGLG